MARYICTICQYVYDEDVGIPEKGISPGTKWNDLPDNWVCPVCGSPKMEFRLLDDGPSNVSGRGKTSDTKGAGLTGSVKVPAGHGDDVLRELSFAEAAILCSNLSKGCERQYLMEESVAFREISEYYLRKAGVIECTFDDLMELIDRNLSTNGEALDVAIGSGDRGSYRATLWNDNVSRVLSSLLSRFSKEGDGFLMNTNVYVCDICGFIYVGDEPPEICPICKVPNAKLLEVRRSQ